MVHHKTNSKKANKTGPEIILTKATLEKIRAILPFGWRKMIHEKHASISLRQITQVFAQRTTNPCDNVKVWREINFILTNAGEKELARQVQVRLSFYRSLCNATQK